MLSSFILPIAITSRNLLRRPLILAKPGAAGTFFTTTRSILSSRSAEGICSCDKVEPGTFERLQDEIYVGVVDTNDDDDFRTAISASSRSQEPRKRCQLRQILSHRSRKRRIDTASAINSLMTKN